MSSTFKIAAALIGCVAIAFLWLGGDDEVGAPQEARPQVEKPSVSGPGKPKRQMLLNQPMERSGLGDAESRRPRNLPKRLQARSKKMEERKARALLRTPNADEGVEHWRNVVLNDPDPDERADALTQLDYDEPGAMAVLAQALHDRDVEVRLSALEELWVNADEPPLDLLAPVLDDPEAEVRAEAVRMIAESEDPQAAALLETALGDADEDVRSEAADALDIDEDTLEPLF